MPSNYAIGAMNDPYFMAAYQSPNYYQLAATQAQQSPSFQAAPQAASTAVTVPQEEYVQEEDKGSRKKLVAGTILAVGAAVLCHKAYGMGAKNLEFLPRLADGFKNMWGAVKGWFSSTSKSVGEKLGLSSETLQVAEKNGKKVCQIPGQVNNIRGANAIEELEKIGASTDIKGLLNAEGKLASGSQLRAYSFDFNGINVSVNKGKITKMTQDGKDVLAKFMNPIEKADVAVKEEIGKMVSQFSKGENLDILRNIKYSNAEDGISRLYTMSNIGETPKLVAAVTKDLPIDSKYVNAFRLKASQNNPKVEEFLTAWSEGKLDISKLTGGKLKTEIGTFVVKENGEITELITKSGQHLKAGSVDFLDLQYKHKEIFANVPKRHALYTDRVYAMAA